MLNPNRPVIKWALAILQPIKYVYPVYVGFAPPAPGDQYIVIRARSSQQGSDKSSFTSTVQLIIDCVAVGKDFGYQDADAISDEVLPLIDSETAISLASPFYANALYVTDISNEEGLTPDSNVFRTLVTYNLTVTQTL